MAIALSLLAGLALLFVLVLAAPLEIRLSYSREGERDLLGLYLFVWPSLGLKCRIVMLDFKAGPAGAAVRYRTGPDRPGGPAGKTRKIFIPNIPELARQASFWGRVYGRIRPSLNYLRSKTRITRLNWKTGFGLGDPFHTGLASGMIWSIKGFLVSLLYSQIRASGVPLLAVIPDFNRAGLAVSLDFRLATRAVHIPVAVLWMLARLVTGGLAVKTARMLMGRGKKPVPPAGGLHRWNIPGPDGKNKYGSYFRKTINEIKEAGGNGRSAD